jgi:hypothetical protein
MKEPTITINGQTLSEAEAMTIRVALESLAFSLVKGLGDDAHGKAITEGYKRAIASIRQLMFQPNR